jgi:hypothetical protein
MGFRIEELGGQRLLVLDNDGPVLARVQDAIDLIAEALPQGVHMIVAPVARFDPSFFQLRSGLAGEVVQKIVNYRLKLAVVGDISQFVSESKAFADFVRESNRGGSVYFFQDMDALKEAVSNWQLAISKGKETETERE